MIAYKNAKKIITETGADAVKLEGGEKISDTLKYLTQKGNFSNRAYWNATSIM